MRPPTFITKLQTSFGHILERQLPIEKIEQQSWSYEWFHVLVLAYGVRKDLVKGLSEQDDFISASFKFLNEDATLDLLGGLSGVGHVEYLSLSFPLVLHILGTVNAITNGYSGHFTHLIESDVLPLVGFETDKLNEPVPILGILHGAELENHPVVLCDQSPLLEVFCCQLVEQDQEVS